MEKLRVETHLAAFCILLFTHGGSDGGVVSFVMVGLLLQQFPCSKTCPLNDGKKACFDKLFQHNRTKISLPSTTHTNLLGPQKDVKCMDVTEISCRSNVKSTTTKPKMLSFRPNTAVQTEAGKSLNKTKDIDNFEYCLTWSSLTRRESSLDLEIVRAESLQ